MPLNPRPALTPERFAACKASGFWDDLTILDHLDRRLAETPDRLALVDHNSMTGQRTQLTYREIDRRATAIAAGLAALGVERGDVVSCQLPNWWQFVALHLAAMRIGAVTNPVMPIFRERELEFMLRLAETKVLVVPERFRGFDHPRMARELQARLPQLARVLVIAADGRGDFDAMAEATPTADTRALFASRRPSPDDVIQILYTSGTTGEPKGVMHTSNSLLCNLVQYSRRQGLTADDVTIMASPLAHQTGFLFGIMNPILLGGKAVLQDVWNPAEALDLIEREGVTFTISSTPFLADLTEAADKRREAVRTLRVFTSGGAPVPRALVRRATEVLGADIVSLWGMTENGAVSCTRPGDPPEKVFETDGIAVPSMELQIRDADGRPAPPDVEGRLMVRGPGMFVGYLKRPEWYALDADGWFDTGDLARMDADGYIRITGRSKDVIIRGGENIPVVEIEGLVYQHPAVAEVAIVAMPDPRLGERSCAFVVLRAGASLDLPGLVRFLDERKCARQYLPERLEIVAEMPRTPSGKIQKFRLRELARELRPER